jgi:hypothetical protein
MAADERLLSVPQGRTAGDMMHKNGTVPQESLVETADKNNKQPPMKQLPPVVDKTIPSVKAHNFFGKRHTNLVR